MKNILIINAHQYYPVSTGSLNKSMVQIAKDFFEENNHQVQLSIIDEGYETEAEAEKHEWADLVLTQMPVYWFGGPWNYKKYIDEVFNHLIGRKKLALSDGRSRFHDNQYGTGGLDHGKSFLLSSTWNAPEKAFGDKNQFLFEGRNLDDALIGITSVYKFMGFEILQGFACYDVMKAPQIENDIIRFKKRLSNIFK